MKLLRPFTVTNDNLTSNITETGSEYSAAASYALNEVVINAAGTAPTHHSYQSLVAGNLGNALTDASKWLDIGPTNRFAMFDNVNGTVTTGASGIDATVAITGRADGIALLGLSAQTVRVTVAVNGAAVRTNLFLYSEQFDNGAGWATSSASITANAAVSPDGSTTADKLTADTTSNYHYMQQITSFNVNVYDSFTSSVYVKAAGYSQITLMDSSINGFSAQFDLTLGTVLSKLGVAGGAVPISASITAVGDGWYRCCVSGTFGPANGGSPSYPKVLLGNGGAEVFIGDGTSGVYLWGAQLETGLVLTSYIMTTSAAASSTTLGIYEHTYNLQSNSGITSWYDYFSEEIVYATDLIVTDIPLYTNPLIRVQINSATGTVTCGTMALGQTRDLGGTTYGVKTGIQDYSRKEIDTFGNYTLVQRSFAKRSTNKVVCENDQIDSIFNLLAEVRATPVVWLGTDDYASTWLFGWARDWAIEITYPTKSYLSIEIEGLT